MTHKRLTPKPAGTDRQDAESPLGAGHAGGRPLPWTRSGGSSLQNIPARQLCSGYASFQKMIGTESEIDKIDLFKRSISRVDSIYSELNESNSEINTNKKKALLLIIKIIILLLLFFIIIYLKKKNNLFIWICLN